MKTDLADLAEIDLAVCPAGKPAGWRERGGAFHLSMIKDLKKIATKFTHC